MWCKTKEVKTMLALFFFFFASWHNKGSLFYNTISLNWREYQFYWAKEKCLKTKQQASTQAILAGRIRHISQIYKSPGKDNTNQITAKQRLPSSGYPGHRESSTAGRLRSKQSLQAPSSDLQHPSWSLRWIVIMSLLWSRRWPAAVLQGYARLPDWCSLEARWIDFSFFYPTVLPRGGTVTIKAKKVTGLVSTAAGVSVNVPTVKSSAD